MADFKGRFRLEQSKSSVPERLAMYLSEGNVSAEAEAAALANGLLRTRGRDGEIPLLVPIRSGAAPPERKRAGAGFGPGPRGDRFRDHDDVCHRTVPRCYLGHLKKSPLRHKRGH